MTGFHRSSSLPEGPSTRCDAKVRAAAAYHVRSTSLPCRSHSLVSQIEDEISSVRAWQAEHVSSSTPLVAGMGRLELLLHGALHEFLHLPQTQQCLRSSSTAEGLLDDFLCIADAYGCFRDALVSVEQIQSDAQAAIRRRDTSKLGSLGKAMRKAEKEIAKLGSALLGLTASANRPVEVEGATDTELVGILREVMLVVASASAALFSGFAAISASSFSHGCSSWTSILKKKLASSKDICHGELESKLKGLKELEKCITNFESGNERVFRCLKELEKCITNFESGNERVFRCLIKTRVSLLNTLTL